MSESRQAEPEGVAENHPALELTVILPTFNERGNIGEMIDRLSAALEDVRHEILVMDDRSPDGTADVAREAAGDRTDIDVVERQPPHGLTRSILDGVERARGRVVVWMDCDLSHPPELVADLLVPLAAGRADVVCASRYVAGGVDGRDTPAARIASWAITRLAMLMLTSLMPPSPL